MTRRCLVLLILVMSSRVALAQTAQAPAPAAEPDYPIIRVGVLSYVQYDYELKARRKYLSRPGSVTIAFGEPITIDREDDPTRISSELERRVRELG